jgi:hypothetical protein
MPIHSCKKHGLAGVKMVCSHVAKGIDNGVPLKTNLIETGDFFVPKIRLCNECITVWKRLSNEAEKEKFMESLVPICGKCFDESERSQ